MPIYEFRSIFLPLICGPRPATVVAWQQLSQLYSSSLRRVGADDDIHCTRQLQNFIFAMEKVIFPPPPTSLYPEAPREKMLGIAGRQDSHLCIIQAGRTLLSGLAKKMPSMMVRFISLFTGRRVWNSDADNSVTGLLSYSLE